MAAIPSGVQRARSFAAQATPLARWPTGAKLLLLLSAALMPLALIAMFAALQMTRIADTEARSRLRSSVIESGRALSIELVGDMTALRAAVDALERDPDDAPSCARAQGAFALQRSSGTLFAILDRRGRVICGTAFPGAADAAAEARDGSAPVAARVGDKGVALAVVGRRGRVAAAAYFPTPFLAEVARPTTVDHYGLAIVGDNARLSLRDLSYESALERRETSRTALGIADLVAEMQVRSAPIGSPLALAMLLPLVMWAAAATIAWLVVDRLLIRPLRKLRRSVAAFTPGDEIDPGAASALPAQEIRELGDTFRAISRTVALHEAGLAEGLVRQTKLTREVHHRVKNNLQVISSLINLHARGADSAEATQAFTTIQRRVDALAVVHRHHYAEIEDKTGIPLRAVLGELAANIRGGGPGGDGARPTIALDVAPLAVSQDIAVAVAFLVTETIELAITGDPAAHIRVSTRAAEEGRAVLRVSSPALADSPVLAEALERRFGRVMEGLARQLRAPLHHDPLVGAYEITIVANGAGAA